MLFCILCYPPKQQSSSFQKPGSKAAQSWLCAGNSFFPPYVHLRQAIKQVYGYLFASTGVKACMNHYTENYFSFSVYMPDLDSFAVL